MKPSKPVPVIIRRTVVPAAVPQVVTVKKPSAPVVIIKRTVTGNKVVSKQAPNVPVQPPSTPVRKAKRKVTPEYIPMHCEDLDFFAGTTDRAMWKEAAGKARTIKKSGRTPDIRWYKDHVTVS